jgi:hypothetical protein
MQKSFSITRRGRDNARCNGFREITHLSKFFLPSTVPIDASRMRSAALISGPNPGKVED